MSNGETNYIDTAMLDNLSQFLSPEKLQALMKRYIDDSTRILEQLTESLASDNAKESHRHFHSLKSTSANVGATQLSTLSGELEELARQNQLDDIKPRVAELNQIFQATSANIAQLEIMQQKMG